MHKRSGSNNRTSVLVSKQVPEFVQEQHQLFVQFLEYYYKFLEQDGQAMYVAKNFSDYLDIDTIYADVNEPYGESHEEYDLYHTILEGLYSTYIHMLPQSIIVDKAMILKHAKDFYRGKGSEKSVQFLIRALFGKESTIYLPKTDVLKTSQGVWYIEKTLKVSDIEISDVDTDGFPLEFTRDDSLLNRFVGHTVFGLDSNAYATVEKTNVFYENGQLVNELSISGQMRDFVNGEQLLSDVIIEGVPKKLRANLFSGVLGTTQIISGGSGYRVGDVVPLIPGDKGAEVIISKVSSGGLNYIIIENTGAGFQAGDQILIVGDGTGARAVVQSVDDSGTIHPNSYNIISSTISLEANTPIGNATYSNLSIDITDPANAWISNTMSYWTYGNTGPLKYCVVVDYGTNYTSVPSMNVSSNTVVRSLGILGKMEVFHGGLHYTVGDEIEIVNPIGSFGTGAAGEVSSVNASGAITGVRFVEVPGNPIGGTGYSQSLLPTANVHSVYGSNADIRVTSTLGSGERIFSVGETAGVIKQLTVTKPGAGYYESPYLNFAGIPYGFGAQASVSIISGVYSYPGRFIGDNGFISSFNFLEDRDYYQDYSYVIRAPESFNKYRKVIKDLVHPVGTNVFADYFLNIENVTGNQVSSLNRTYVNKLLRGTFNVNEFKSAIFNITKIKSTYQPYVIPSSYSLNTTPLVTVFNANSDIIQVATNGNFYKAGHNVYLQFNSIIANVPNGMYTISYANTDYFTVSTVRGNTVRTYTEGTIRVYDPEMKIASYQHGLASNDVIYTLFDDLVGMNTTPHLGIGNVYPLANGDITTNYYKIRKVGIDYFTIEHPNVHQVWSNQSTGYVNVYTNIVTVNATSHGLKTNDLTYLSFENGNVSNAADGYYYVDTVKDANSFNVYAPQIVLANGNANLYTTLATIKYNRHKLVTGNGVYVSVPGSNIHGYYIVSVVNANAFRINTQIPISNDYTTTANVYLPNVDHDSARIYKTNHGFSLANTVIVNFGDSNITNSIFYVTDVADANSFNVSNIQAFVLSNVSMLGNVTVSLFDKNVTEIILTSDSTLISSDSDTITEDMI